MGASDTLSRQPLLPTYDNCKFALGRLRLQFPAENATKNVRAKMKQATSKSMDLASSDPLLVQATSPSETLSSRTLRTRFRKGLEIRLIKADSNLADESYDIPPWIYVKAALYGAIQDFNERQRSNALHVPRSTDQQCDDGTTLRSTFIAPSFKGN